MCRCERNNWPYQFLYDFVLDSTVNSIILCHFYDSCLWRIVLDCLTVAYNFFRYSQIDMLFECLCCRHSTVVNNNMYFTNSIQKALVLISAPVWIVLFFFLIGHILVMLFYDLWYQVHRTITKVGSISVRYLEYFFSTLVLTVWENDVRSYDASGLLLFYRMYGQQVSLKD